MSAKSITQPVVGSTSPRTWSSTRKEWPCKRPHLWPGGTLGRRWAASKVNSLKSSIASHPPPVAVEQDVQLRQDDGLAHRRVGHRALGQPIEFLQKRCGRVGADLVADLEVKRDAGVAEVDRAGEGEVGLVE